MKAYGRMEVYLHLFLRSSLEVNDVWIWNGFICFRIINS
jgi:hypothetical protein